MLPFPIEDDEEVVSAIDLKSSSFVVVERKIVSDFGEAEDVCKVRDDNRQAQSKGKSLRDLL